MIERGDWQVSEIARNAYDLEGKVVGTIGAGRIGYRVLQRLLPFDCKELLYFDYTALPEQAERTVNAKRVEDLKEFVSKCDVVTVNCPLHEGTRGLVNAELLKHFKKARFFPLLSSLSSMKDTDFDRLFSINPVNRVHGSSTPPVVPSVTRMPSPQPSLPASSTAMRVTSGTSSPRPRTTSGAR